MVTALLTVQTLFVIMYTSLGTVRLRTVHSLRQLQSNNEHSTYIL